MKLKELVEKEKMPSVKTPTVDDLASKHKVSKGRVEREIEKGTKVELEHTDCPVKAKEIAMDHLGEFLDYYDRLRKMEDEAKRSN